MRRLSVLKLIVGFVLVLGAFIALNLTGFSAKIKNSFFSFSSSFQESLWSSGNGISNFFEGFLNSGRLKKEVDILLTEKEDLISRLIQEELLRQENENLRAALDLKEAEGFELATVKIIGKDISRDSILINKGSKDGIEKDMPIITVEKVLVGKVTTVYDDFSEVMLVSNPEFSFDIQIFEKNIYGVEKGEGSLESYIDLIPKEKDVLPGDIVLTAVLGGMFPEGLLVGEVRDVKNSDVETFQQAQVSLYLNIDNLDDLLVIKDF